MKPINENMARKPPQANLNIQRFSFSSAAKLPFGGAVDQQREELKRLWTLSRSLQQK